MNRRAIGGNFDRGWDEIGRVTRIGPPASGRVSTVSSSRFHRHPNRVRNSPGRMARSEVAIIVSNEERMTRNSAAAGPADLSLAPRFLGGSGGAGGGSLPSG